MSRTKPKFTPRLVAVSDRRGDVLLSSDQPVRHVRDMLDSRRHRPIAAMATRIPECYDRDREEKAKHVRLILAAMAWGSAVVGVALLLLEFI